MWVDGQDILDRLPEGMAAPADTYLATKVTDAEALISADVPNVQALIDSGDIPGDRVRLVVARMVIRHLLNPTGVRQRAAGQGPFTESTTYGGDNPGDLEFTASDRRTLLGLPGRGRAFSVDTTPR